MPCGNFLNTAFCFRRILYVLRVAFLNARKGSMTTFAPVEELPLFCRFCNKILPAQLDRSIAKNGRTVDRNSTFEYYCTKCFKTACFTGNDLVEQPPENSTPSPSQSRDYSPHEHYLIGETIRHKAFRQTGIIVGKDTGSPSRILVNFPKGGIKKLVQDL
jgi:hypothetical protein